MYNNNISIIDCPRDAIQGIKDLISSEKKVEYINKLIASNFFEYIDFGSFVSAKAVPQMQDTHLVLDGIEKSNATKLLAIIANTKGTLIASEYQKIDYLGYPFSISETFQQRNTNSSIHNSFQTVQEIQNILSKSNQELVIYISMAFGNPYGDVWNEDIVLNWISKLKDVGIQRFSIADTTGEATAKSVESLYKKVHQEFKTLDLSLHLHSTPDKAFEKINAGFKAGCRRFEGAVLGYGGCPFAQDDLVGNIPTELLLKEFKKGDDVTINRLKIDFYELIS